LASNLEAQSIRGQRKRGETEGPGLLAKILILIIIFVADIWAIATLACPVIDSLR
jgi:hypothetical protein